MGGFNPGSSLIDPIDALRFAFAFLGLILAPGYALATLLRPLSRHTERGALALPCAYSLVTITGLATEILHLPFRLLSYAILAFPITLAGIYTAWRYKEKAASNTQRFWWWAPFAVAIIQVSAIAAIYARDVVPPGPDTPSHVAWTQLIAHTHAFPIALLSSYPGAGEGGFYPPTFHAVTALILNAAPMVAYRAVFLNVVATISLLPLALFAYVQTATRSATYAGLAALASLAFEPVPFDVLSVSNYTLIAALPFTPALALALYHGLRDTDRRALALAALLGIGLFYTHPTEFITAALLALAIVPGQLHSMRAWLRAAACTCVVVASWVIAASPTFAAVRHTMVAGAQSEIQAMHLFVRSAHPHLHAVWNGYLYMVYAHNLSGPLFAAVVTGIIWCIVRRRFLGLVAAQVILCALFVDSSTFNLLQRFYILAYPWPQWDRLAATHYLFAPPLAAVGTAAIYHTIQRAMRRSSRAFRAVVIASVVAVGLILPLDATIIHAIHSNHDETFISRPDLTASAWLSRNAPRDSVIVNDANLLSTAGSYFAIDAGIWMPALGTPQPLFWRFDSGVGEVKDRLYVLQHITDVPLPPRAQRFISRYRVHYVFYGPTGPSARRHLNLSRLLADPYLHLVFKSTPCSSMSGQRAVSCRASGTYIFTLDANSYPTAVQA